MRVSLLPLDPPPSLRFFIRADGLHAGGITVHSVSGARFSYGIAVSGAMRRRGVASSALPLLFASMKARGFSVCAVQIAPDNAASLALHRCITSGETPFMARYPEECTRDAEALGAWLQGMAEDAQNFAVTAFDGGNVVGDLGIQRFRAHFRMQHRANLGVSIQAAYCGCGLGRAMLQIAVAQARENGFEQIELGVFADNVRAIHLYRSLGFEDFGCTPRAFRLKDGTYHDERIMVKFL